MATPHILEATNNNILLVAKKLNEGYLAAFPTDTVYGLAASMFLPRAIEKIFHYKNRPAKKPLIALVANIEEIEDNFITNEVFHVVKHLLPGPITLILKKKNTSKFSKLGETLNSEQAVRIPNHKIALDLLRASGPLFATSANISNHLSPLTAQAVANNFQNQELYLLQGISTFGIESTIINISNPKNIQLIRHGAVSLEQLTTLGLKFTEHNFLITNPANSFYNLRTPILLNMELPRSSNNKLGYLAFGEINAFIPDNITLLNLSLDSDLIEAGRNLFQMLAHLDTMQLEKIYIAPIPNIGLGLTINNRLLTIK